MSEEADTPRAAGQPVEGGSRAEAIAAVAALCFMAALAVVYIMRGDVDSDEPQHLHVAWGWTQGLVQYRDVFDNHTPLYHVIMSRPMRALGERADIIVAMRFVNAVFFAAALAMTWLLARRFFDGTRALWVTAITAAYPAFFRYGLQARPASLWVALWLGALVVLTGDRTTWKKAFAAGMILGAALCVSIKTAMLVVSLALAAAAVMPFVAQATAERTRRGGVLRIAAAFGGGFAALPAAMAAVLYGLGALGAFYRCVVAHNMVSGIGRWGHPWQFVLFPAVAAGSVVAARKIAAFAGGGSRGQAAAFVTAAAGVNLACLALMPIVRPQTTLTVAPAAAIAVSVIVTQLVEKRAGFSRRAARAVLIAAALAVIAVEVAATLAMAEPWRDQTVEEETLIADVLTLTGPDDYVMDAKGETVFRRRPFYYAIETLTSERMRRGEIADDIPERLIETRTCIVGGLTGRFPPRAKEFMKENYLWTGTLAVAGKMLSREPCARGTEIPFEVEIPARYEVVGEYGRATGDLDGRPYVVPSVLAEGRHVWRCGEDGGPIALLWSDAAEKGFTATALGD